MHCAHINLKIVCPVTLGLWTPSVGTPCCIHPSVVRLIIQTVKCACRHSDIWYLLWVRYLYSSTCYKKDKADLSDNPSSSSTVHLYKSVADQGGGSGGSAPPYQTWCLFEIEILTSTGWNMTFWLADFFSRKRALHFAIKLNSRDIQNCNLGGYPPM